MAERDSLLQYGLLAALFGVLLRAGTASTPQPATAVAPRATPAPETPAAPSALPDSVGRGQRLLEQFIAGAGPVPELPEHPPPFRLDVLIATVPDPYDSHFGWTYDQQLEALRRAFETAGYVPDRFWIPGRSDRTSVEVTPVAGDTAHRREVPLLEAQPAVMLFRSASDADRKLRLLYLVGELPTSGVHVAALRTALDERARLLGPRAPLGKWIERDAPAPDDTAPAADAVRASADTIRIIGPTFSGSASSIRRVLDQWLAGSDTVGSTVYLVSGSATDRDALQALATPAAPGSSRQRIVARATRQPDQVMDSVFRHRVMPALDLTFERVAVLRESGTVFGRALDSASVPDSGDASLRDTAGESDQDTLRTKPFLTVPFPLNIASLRTEYERHGGAAAPVETGELGGQPRTSRIPLALADSAREKESPAIVSELTAPSLEQVVDDITRTLRARGIRAVVIVASDVRDKLFLAERLRERMRDLRFVTYEANVLYLRPEYDEMLRGMLVLSSYPLILKTQQRSSHTAAGPQLLAFPSDDAEGTYNAALYQLLGDSAPLLDYVGAPAAKDTNRRSSPAAWVALLGGGSFLPLTVVDSMDGGAHVQRVASGSAQGEREWLLDRITPLPLLLWAATAVAIVLLVVREYGGPLTRAVSAGRPVRQSAEVSAHGSTVAAPWHERWPGGVEGAHSLRRRYREAEGTSLDLQASVATCTLFVGLAVVYVPVTLALPQLIERSWLDRAWLLLLPIAASLALVLTLVAGLWSWVVHVSRFSVLAFGYAMDHGWQEIESSKPARIRKRLTWLLELAHLLVFVAAVALPVLVLQYTLEVDGLDGKLRIFRAMHLNSGISPLATILVIGMGLIAWSVWARARVRLLRQPSLFEEVSRARINGRPELEYPAAARPRPDAGYHEAIACAVEQLRRQFVLLIPPLRHWMFWGPLAFLGGWLLSQFEPTFEGIGRPGAAGPDPQLSSFDFVLRIGITLMLGMTVWAVHRLLSTWQCMKELLWRLGCSPLAPAFERLPGHVTRLLQPTLFSPFTYGTIEHETYSQWRELHRVHAWIAEARVQPSAVRVPQPQPVAAGVAGQLSTAAMEAYHGAPAASHDGNGSVTDRVRQLMAHGEWPIALLTRSQGVECREEQRPLLRELQDTLEDVWASEPHAEALTALAKDLTGEKRSDKSYMSSGTSKLLHRMHDGELLLWVRLAEEVAAVQATDYILWARRQLRWLAMFVIAALVLSTMLLSSYWFEPQSLFKLAFGGLILAAMGVLLLIMVEMNRDAVISRIANGIPGRVDWSVGFVLNLLLTLGVPLLAFLSSEFPAVRSILFAWVKPLLREFAKL